MQHQAPMTTSYTSAMPSTQQVPYPTTSYVEYSSSQPMTVQGGMGMANTNASYIPNVRRPMQPMSQFPSREIYTPPETSYVPPGTALKGGMYPIYDQTAVPTFEAPLVFETVNESVMVEQRAVEEGSEHRHHHHKRHPSGAPPKRTRNFGCC